MRLVTAAFALVSVPAMAQDCSRLQDAGDRQTCQRETAAAMREAKRGGLEEGQGHKYRENALARCAVLREEDRKLCERRMRGEGTVSGSVESGGIYRELRTVE